MVVECLNGYRLKEPLPTNLGEFKTPIGVIETIKQGTDITLVSYGSTLRIIEQAAKELQQVGIDRRIDRRTIITAPRYKPSDGKKCRENKQATCYR